MKNRAGMVFCVFATVGMAHAATVQPLSGDRMVTVTKEFMRCRGRDYAPQTVASLQKAWGRGFHSSQVEDRVTVSDAKAQLAAGSAALFYCLGAKEPATRAFLFKTFQNMWPRLNSWHGDDLTMVISDQLGQIFGDLSFEDFGYVAPFLEKIYFAPKAPWLINFFRIQIPRIASAVMARSQTLMEHDISPGELYLSKNERGQRAGVAVDSTGQPISYVAHRYKCFVILLDLAKLLWVVDGHKAVFDAGKESLRAFLEENNYIRCLLEDADTYTIKSFTRFYFEHVLKDKGATPKWAQEEEPVPSVKLASPVTPVFHVASGPSGAGFGRSFVAIGEEEESAALTAQPTAKRFGVSEMMGQIEEWNKDGAASSFSSDVSSISVAELQKRRIARTMPSDENMQEIISQFDAALKAGDYSANRRKELKGLWQGGFFYEMMRHAPQIKEQAVARFDAGIAVLHYCSSCPDAGVRAELWKEFPGMCPQLRHWELEKVELATWINDRLVQLCAPMRPGQLPDATDFFFSVWMCKEVRDAALEGCRDQIQAAVEQLTEKLLLHDIHAKDVPAVLAGENPLDMQGDPISWVRRDCTNLRKLASIVSFLARGRVRDFLAPCQDRLCKLIDEGRFLNCLFTMSKTDGSSVHFDRLPLDLLRISLRSQSELRAARVLKPASPRARPEPGEVLTDWVGRSTSPGPVFSFGSGVGETPGDVIASNLDFF